MYECEICQTKFAIPVEVITETFSEDIIEYKCPNCGYVVDRKFIKK